MGMPPVQIRADHIAIIEASGEGLVITCARGHRTKVPLGQCGLFGLLLMRSDSPFALQPIEADVVWPSTHVKQVLIDLVNNGFHDYQAQDGIHRIPAHDILVRPSSIYPAQSVNFHIDRYDC
jgi:hypothetical protein